MGNSLSLIGMLENIAFGMELGFGFWLISLLLGRFAPVWPART